jgi:uncharacterized repeat protein (TIGR01451 family)
VPAVVSRLQANGRLSATTNLTLAIGLPLRNTEALTNLLKDIYDPTSPNYHHYLTPDEFTAQFGPTAQDYQNVLDFARTNGLSVTKTHGNRVLLDVTGKVSDIEKAFHLTMRTYRHPTEPRDFFAPDADPSVPSMLSVQDISGLENYSQPHPNYRIKPANLAPVTTAGLQKNSTPNAATGSGPLGNYIGDDFRNAYVPGTSLNGSGQTVALVQFDGYLASDINEYETLVGRTNIPLQNVLLDGFNGLPTGNGGEVEVSLDIEMAISMAPALSQVILYEGNPDNFLPNDVLNRIVTDNSARQISCSWGWSGGPTATTDQIFKQMAVQGQTFFDAVGDSDAFTAGVNSINGVDNPILPNVPSDNPYITQVGGTTLTMNGLGASYSSETVWNWDVRYPNQGYDGVGSSGGISSYYSIPSWQANVNMTASQGSATFRNTPDVALTADDVFVIADGGVQYLAGGTSCASPLWAGFTALVNQQAAAKGMPVVGFINPALYAIAANAPSYAVCFHDITTGNNEWSSSPNLFSAVPGYDLATGLGTPNGTNLINALVGTAGNFPVQLSAPAPPYGSTLSALNGGNPNGTWELFVQDSTTRDSGAISNGWSLTLTLASPVGYSADTALSMVASATNVLVSNNVVFIVGITNYGPSTSSNVLVSDTLPSGITLVSTNITPGSAGSVSHVGKLVIWNIGSLTNGAGAQLALTMSSGTVGTIINSATVQAGTPNPDSSDVYASAAVNIVSSLSPPVVSGASVGGGGGAFHLTISNPSGSPVVIQASTNLVNWVNVYTSSLSSISFTDASSSNYIDRYYRAVEQ